MDLPIGLSIFLSKNNFSRISWKNLLTLLSTNFLGNNTYNGFFQENWKFAIHGKLTFWMEKPHNLQNFLTLRNLLILFELSFKHILTGIHTFFFITNFCCFFNLWQTKVLRMFCLFWSAISWCWVIIQAPHLLSTSLLLRIMVADYRKLKKIVQSKIF